MGNSKKAQDLMKAANVELAKAQKHKQELHALYKKEKKVPMYLSPMYAAHFGKVMRVMINGISIFFKVDGKTQNVPKTFADEIDRRRIAVDTMLSKQTRLSEVKNNAERTPGELNLI